MRGRNLVEFGRIAAASHRLIAGWPRAIRCQFCAQFLKAIHDIGISPLVDFAFKLMLASPGHERVTIHFLNAILGENARITSVQIQNPIVGPTFEDDKWIVLDVLAVDDQGRKFNVEMQTSVPPGLRQRLAFYDARLYIEQMREGDRYHELRPAIVICVLAESLLKDTERLHTDFRLRDETGRVLTDDLQIHLLELTKLIVTRDNLESATSAERWAFFLLNADKLTMEEIQELFPDPEFAEAAGVLKVIKDTPEQMDTYISRLKYKLDEDWRIEATRSEALREGEARGEARGKAKGRQEGELIGRIETLREVLGLAEPTHEQLQSYDGDQLAILCEQLQSQLRSRRS